MFKVLFVCSGNICRSPTAQGVFAHQAIAAGLADKIAWDSAGTHGFHAGQAPDMRSSAAALKRGYDLSNQRARQVVYGDFDEFDLILCMDKGHMETLLRASKPEHHSKIQMFDTRDVGDPYYGGAQGFDDVLDQIEDACARWVQQLQLKSL